ncbi:MerR family transcriptional regulator [Lacticaseibacillus hegangensis]|uniref:MerR family transcriptional regulator n=1 Tax=Lacticaseibacillus hegangensis TaxID=2486010 RepID=A0ABW4CUL3_9LACO|nr:MerR family transcriptional regulator [Lacticaseibacillus hegangensis]
MPELSDIRTRAVLPISTVIALTDLTARQIRYYEAQGLLHPLRTPGNHRMYSLKDVDDLVEIHSQLAAGFSLAELRDAQKQPKPKTKLSDEEVRAALRSELLNQGRLNPRGDSPTQGFGFRP